jgi:hypothetical protein
VDTDVPLIEGCVEELTEEQKEEIDAKMQAKKEQWMAMTDEEKAAKWQEKKDVREANAATVLGCSCCREGGTDNVADLVRGKEGAVAKTLGFRKPREEGGGKWHGQGFGGSEVNMEEKCARFQGEGKCDAEEAPDCTQVNTMKRYRHHGGRWFDKLYCNCCEGQDVGGSDEGGD